MTDKTNLAFTDRQIEILDRAMGQLILLAAEANSHGESLFIDRQELTPGELLDVVRTLADRTSLPTTATASATLTNKEKFVVSSAVGALVGSLHNGDPERVNKVKETLVTVVNKLELFPGAIAGSEEFTEGW